jgi:hypothetical protein
MRKLLIFSAMVLALALPAASSGAGHWIGYPSCSATTSAITCTGTAAGLHPQSMPGLGRVEAAIEGEVHYTCSDPVWQFIFYGFPVQTVLGTHVLAAVEVRNGKPFSIQYAPPATPTADMALVLCQGTWTRDPNYYNVRVALGWGFGGAVSVTALEASIGTVVAQ